MVLFYRKTGQKANGMMFIYRQNDGG